MREPNWRQEGTVQVPRYPTGCDANPASGLIWVLRVGKVLCHTGVRGRFQCPRQVVVHESTKVGYWGVTNNIVTWLVFIWRPLAGYSFYKVVKAGPGR